MSLITWTIEDWASTDGTITVKGEVIRAQPSSGKNIKIWYHGSWRGLLTWSNQDDRMNMTEPWQRRTLFFWIWPKLKPTNLMKSELATLLGRANIKFFKVEFKKLFIFYLMVLFCCDVGESDLILKPRYGSFNVIYRKSQFNSISYSLILGLSWKTDIRSVIKSL